MTIAQDDSHKMLRTDLDKNKPPRNVSSDNTAMNSQCMYPDVKFLESKKQDHLTVKKSQADEGLSHTTSCVILGQALNLSGPQITNV